VPLDVRARSPHPVQITGGGHINRLRAKARFPHATHVGVEDLELAEDGVREQHANRRFPNEPIASNNVQRRPVQRVWVYRCAHDREAGEKHETGPESPPRSTVRYLRVSLDTDGTYPWKYLAYGSLCATLALTSS
jgi:hypothetical protein